MMALALTVAASTVTVSAAKKKDKKQQAPVVLPVKLLNGSDTLSYVGGKYMTEGLTMYLQQQGIDTTYMADFIGGFKQAMADMNDPKKMAYNMGIQIASQVKNGMMPRLKRDFVETTDTIIDEVLLRGFTDALDNDSTVFTQANAVQVYKDKLSWNKKDKEERLYGPNRDAGRHYLDSLKADTTIIRTESGLMYKVLVKGEGEVPQRTDKVLVNYEGRLIDGTVFDASAKHGNKPATFRPDQVIVGWTEALTMMPVGSKWQLYIPNELAYGSRNTGNIKPFSALIFDVELVGIDKPAAEPAATEVKAQPKAKGKRKK